MAAAPPARKWPTLVNLFLLVSCCKILLMPSYRSTDFDVHRNWLAITHHLPIKEWYYDDVNGTTVHTLDYPPSFAYFEYFLANNYVTQALLYAQGLDDRCLALLPDSDNTPSQACVVFHRSTVILSDIVLWWGAWIASHAVVVVSPTTTRTSPQQPTAVGMIMLGPAGNIPASFLLIVLHPGLLWLDHVHFQYNGMLFGIFLASLGYLMRGNHSACKSTTTTTTTFTDSSACFHTNHWKAAVLFALLLTMKHLFLTLAPFYFVYLLRRYCFDDGYEQERESNDDTTKKRNQPVTPSLSVSGLSLQPLRLITLGMYTLTALLVPFLPFLKQLRQVGARLFPFGRGLVHDYWAANVWALYQFADKILTMVGKSNYHLPDVPASKCALLLFLSLLPGLYYGAWLAAARRDNARLILAVVYSALCSFQLGFHVHEKAILNAIIPFILLVTVSASATTNSSISSSAFQTSMVSTYRFLFLQMTALGLLGIFPLLFRKVELPLKLVTYTGYMALCYHILMERNNDRDTIKNDDNTGESNCNASSSFRTKLELWPMTAMVAVIVIILEFVPVERFGKLEFLPLLITSVGCAIGLVLCWFRLLAMIVQVR